MFLGRAAECSSHLRSRNRILPSSQVPDSFMLRPNRLTS